MKPIYFLMAAGAFCFVQMGGAAAQSPAREGGPLAQAITFAKEHEPNQLDYSFVRRIKVDAEDEVFDRTERYDPRLDQEKKWELVAIEGRDPTSEELEEYKTSSFKVNGNSNNFELYHDVIGDLNLEDAFLIKETEDQAFYRLEGDFTEILEEDEVDFGENLEAHLMVDKTDGVPFVSEFRVFAPNPFSKAMIAKIKKFEMQFLFARHSLSGDILPQEVDVNLSVRALFFISVDAVTHIGFSDYQYLKETND
ncbi:hypothetical protein GCM10007972_12180 [Iodidimonas muriae]|uniref:Outer membrane lipoprotein-sorting protein n=1 Tax=Iodidimonas muriae TaxID=261467 RepID=A0ABQ2LE85_9PROT|nr:hypothetical protein [Iodidimonas muriae]GER06784.1 hypothetical protein JCM17843_10940 [Kordiimonadales bacterium JCM 17843]GGO09985.1 hypothetical protein GCM10007972_12180 [Iodidimonas muriae]